MNIHNMPKSSGNFNDWQEYESLIEWLKQSDDWEDVEVSESKNNIGLHETWYRCKSTGEVWRLIEPDPPYHGEWEQISWG